MMYDDDDELDEQIAQGRFIVQARGMKDHIFHEVITDFQDAQLDLQNDKITERGSFETVRRSLAGYKDIGITAVYLMGVLERANNPQDNRFTGVGVNYMKESASPLAVTTRNKTCSMLGGKSGFTSVMQEA